MLAMARNTQVAADHDAPPITQILARFVAEHPSRGWTDAVDKEAHRTLLNWIGCAVGAAKHEAADAALAAVQMLQPAAQATVLGRAERVDIASAALINGITSHTFDFDDTHLKTIIHPAGPVASAALALAELIGASGRELIDSLVLGIDVACRIGNTMYPDHYDRGWHITGSTGMFGAAAACARLLQLDRATDRDGARHRRVATDRHARAVRHDDEAVSSGRRGARRTDVGVACEERIHREPKSDRGTARFGAGRIGQAQLE